METGPIEPQDLPELANLYQQLLPNEPSVERMQEALQRTAGDPDHFILGARIDGRLVGSVLGVACQMLFGQCRRFMIVEDMVVDRHHRRLGVGTALLRHLERCAVGRNCSYIMLITEDDREDAVRFYETLGYQGEPNKAFKKAL